MSYVVAAAACRLAKALDVEDYAAARAALAEECVYHTGTATLTGPDAILDSYRASGEQARRRFDEIEYTSRVEPSGPSTVVITYTDRVRLGGAWHEYHCRQHVRLGAAGLVEEIRHEQLPGERERLREFERRASDCG
jgi:hypothetical protein